MGTYRLEKLFNPQSIAVVGASPKPEALGGIVLKALVEGAFSGTLLPVNPKHHLIGALACHPTLKALQRSPDLVVVATPAAMVPDIVAEAAQIGAQTAIVLSAGLGRESGSPGDAALKAARRTGLRLVGPNCLGVLAPTARMNASFARRLPTAGSLALVSQSGAIAAGLAEWAIERKIGFSGIVSLGEAIDVDFGDCLDYFAEDKPTKAILLYIESISDARKFMSAARRAARVKPVIVLKAGRHAEGARAATTHTGALAGSDAVYEAAFQRAGCVRVLDLEGLFTAAEALAVQAPFAGDRVAILTNGGGLGVLAVDRLIDLGGRLAAISEATIRALDNALPPLWSRANPVDIVGDATPDRYAAALSALLSDRGNDAILVLNCPTAVTSPERAAATVIETVTKHRENNRLTKPVSVCWVGSRPELTTSFNDAGMASFATEAETVAGIMHLVNYRRASDALAEAVSPLPNTISVDRAKAAANIDTAVCDNRAWLTPIEVSALMDAYGIAATPVTAAANADEAATAALPLLATTGACVVKILSRDITHKSDVDGVRLNLTSVEAIRSATREVMERAARIKPEARIDGVSIQPMIVRPKARELIAGIAIDPVFGPVILFGHGGTAVELIDDKALSLLPLNVNQANRLIANTRVNRLLKGYRNVPAADTGAIAKTLVRLSRLVEDFPAIVGIDLNPLLADQAGVMALDARVQIDPAAGDQGKAKRRFSVRPYPRELEGDIRLSDGSVLPIRPLRPDDEEALAEMIKHVTPEDRRLRFFSPLKAMDRHLIARLTQLDYDREMAFVVLDPSTNAILGSARMMGGANRESAEYAILVRSDRQAQGLGKALMGRIIEFAKQEGYGELFGSVLAENHKMLNLIGALGFTKKLDSAAGVIMTTLRLRPG